MKQFILTLFAFLCLDLSTYAIEIDGINYEWIEDAKVKVAEGDYSGDIIIPSEIQYYDEAEKITYTYKVTQIDDWAFRDICRKHEAMVRLGVYGKPYCSQWNYQY